jgi:putative acetyltransferase
MAPQIVPAIFPDDRAALLSIWREYIESPATNLDYQNYHAEFDDIPGKYAPPEGAILLAKYQSNILGCIAMRKVSDDICEMKRLYVRPDGRGLGLGKAMVEKLIHMARISGYQEMRLDVLAEFEHAQALYEGFGFVLAEPVSFNPVPGTKFLGLKLSC